MRQQGAKFPARARLTKRAEFLKVSRGGRRVFTPHFIFIGRANDKGESRLGITVSAKVGNAVVRNRIKRRLRELFRRRRREIPLHQDIVIIARSGAGDLSAQQLTVEVGVTLISGGGRRG